MKQVQDMSAAGWINQDMAIDLMDFPDLRSYLNLRNSGVETLKYIIECILEDGEYIPPEPYFNLNLGVQMMESVYGLLVQQDAPADRLSLIRQWVEQAQDMQDMVAQQAAAKQAAMMPPGPGVAGGPATAQGAVAPTSGLLPTRAPAPQLPQAA